MANLGSNFDLHLEAVHHHMDRYTTTSNNEAAKEHYGLLVKHLRAAGLNESWLKTNMVADPLVKSVNRPFEPHGGDTQFGLYKADPTFKFQIGQKHPAIGPAAPAPLSHEQRQRHLDAADHHITHAADARAFRWENAHNPAVREVQQHHVDHATMHLMRAGHSHNPGRLVGDILEARPARPTPAVAPEFKAHPMDAALDTESHTKAAAHHYGGYLHHDEQSNITENMRDHEAHSRIATEHRALAEAHNDMAGGSGSPHHHYLKHQDVRYVPNGVHAVPHPLDNKIPRVPTKGTASDFKQGFSHHTELTAAHYAQARDASRSADRAHHVNIAETHARQAHTYGKLLGLSPKAVDDHMDRLATTKKYRPILPQQRYQAYRNDYALADYEHKVEDHNLRRPQHREAIEHHIDHMLAHHDQAVAHVDTSPETQHHLKMAQQHAQMATNHQLGAGMSGQEVLELTNRRAQEQHRLHVNAETAFEPHHDDSATQDLQYPFTDRNKKLHADQHTFAHSNNIVRGHTNHKDITESAPRDDQGMYSKGTHIADHPLYGKVRMKEAHDIHNERYGDNRAWSDAHRELAVHDLAHKFFGLGAHQHHVGLLEWKSPVRPGAEPPKNLYSVHEQLSNHEQWNKVHAKLGAAKMRDMYKPDFDNGTLHKLATFDHIIGNEDRHGGNVMVHSAGHGKPIQLIDHGLALPNHYSPRHAQAYMEPFVNEDADKGQHHKVREWLNGIDSDAVVNHLKSKGFSDQVTDGVAKRLKHSKEVWDKSEDADEAIRHLTRYTVPRAKDSNAPVTPPPITSPITPVKETPDGSSDAPQAGSPNMAHEARVKRVKDQAKNRDAMMHHLMHGHYHSAARRWEDHSKHTEMAQYHARKIGVEPHGDEWYEAKNDAHGRYLDSLQDSKFQQPTKFTPHSADPDVVSPKITADGAD